MSDRGSPGSAQAGWHTDPTGRHQHRYWDGSAWTEHVSDNGQSAVDPVSAPPVAVTEAGPAHPATPRRTRGIGRIILGVVMILLYISGFFGNPPSVISYAIGSAVLFGIPGVLLILWGWFWAKPRASTAGAVRTSGASIGGAQPVAPAVDVRFDESGRVLGVSVNPAGQWATRSQGQYTYLSRSAGSLLEATELLRTAGSVPPLTYYTVDTPDGVLGRDMNGFYTEAPIKTKNLRLAVTPATRDTVEFAGLKAFGDNLAAESTVAALKSTGEYARLVLMMECGRCGYQSPVETVSGELVRQCYCCGTVNRGTRGGVNVAISGGFVEI
jgi:hypothetical protein